MYNNGTTQPVSTGINQQQGVSAKELTTKQKTEIVNLASDIKRHATSHLPEMYDVSTVCGTGQQGVMIDVRIFYSGNPIAGAQLPIKSVDETSTEREEQAKETSKLIVAQSIGQLMQADNGHNNPHGS